MIQSRSSSKPRYDGALGKSASLTQRRLFGIFWRYTAMLVMICLVSLQDW